MERQDEALIEAFCAYERARGSRPRGITESAIRARRFLSWLSADGSEILDIGRTTAKAYLLNLSEATRDDGNPLSPRTVESYLSAAARLCRYLQYAGLIQSNPFATLRPRRMPVHVIRGVLTEAEMLRLLDSLGRWEDAGSDPRKQGRRYLVHLIAELQYASGLRIAEVAALTCDDLDLEHGIIHVREGKKGRDRTAYLTSYAASLLAVYVNTLRPLVLTAKQAHHQDLLFGAGFQSLARFQNAHLAAVGAPLELSITSHGFRHALGYHLLRAGCQLRHIQEILGHRSIKDTEIYTKVDASAVMAEVDACHPHGIASLGNAS
jgi:site-specific recombinase XerD